MSLNDIYLGSQIAAAVLVAPTLIYLAVQVRSSAEATYSLKNALGGPDSQSAPQEETGR